MSRRLDLVGHIYGRLTVERNISYNPTKWECRCACGRVTIVPLSNLRTGNTTSCGCVFAERMKERFTTHGMTGSPEYRTWSHMIARCVKPTDQDFPDYGGRGIVVCDKWRYSFETFLSDMGHRPSPRHSIDRIDFNGNYEPGNCRWALPIVQANNSRKNRYLTHEGRTMTVRQWERALGFNTGTLQARVTSGWSVERTLTTPVR